jgi:3-isopropylmalate dehydrogenase
VGRERRLKSKNNEERPMSHKILLLPGDGIGAEVMAEARRLLSWLGDRRGVAFETEEGLIGGAAYEAEGTPLSDATIALAKAADAVLLAAVGGPQWDTLDFHLRPEAGLLGIRRELELFANLRPAIVFDALIDASSLKPDIVRGLDMVIVRELTGGVYFGEPRGIFDIGNGERRGINTQVYTTGEIKRVARVAFDLARARQNRVCSVEKANVMESGRLWRDEVGKVQAAEYPDVALSHMYADNCAMQLLRNPRQFDVIVTDNLFGDMLSDEASMLTGSLGMLPSASLGAIDADGKRAALYEPVHGSAPDIAGRGIANPLAMLLSVAMMLRYSFGHGAEAELIEKAASKVLNDGIRTGDIALPGVTPVNTKAMGDAMLAALDSLSG